MQEATQEAGIKGTQVRKETSRKEEEENEDDEAECSSGGRTSQNDSLVMFGDFEDTGAPECAPSYTWRAGLTSDVSSIANVAIAMLYLQEGYIVTMPDKEGKKGAFASGHVEGRQSLDGIRATLAFDKIGLKKEAKVVGHGYSGGGIQTGWTAALKKTYAPEINTGGWVTGGTPTNLTALVERINKGPFAGYVAGGV